MESSPLGSPAIVDPFLLLKGQSLGSKGRAEGRLSQEEKLKEAASQFEQMLLETFLKSARSSEKVFGSEDELFGFNSDFYKEMQGSYLSRSIVESGGIGLQEMLLEQFKQKLGETGEGAQTKGSRLPAPSSPASLKSGAEEGVQPQGVGSSSKTSLILPVAGRLSSAYGTRNDPFDGEQRFHKGMDIAAPAGTLVRSAASGRVLSTGYRQGYGQTVEVEHPDGSTTLYAHLQESLVSEGDSLRQGAVLGAVGSTGRSTGPHLHFEYRKEGKSIDPESVLSRNSSGNLPIRGTDDSSRGGFYEHD